MTYLPHENQSVKGLAGPSFPPYKVGPLCAAPFCSRPVDHRHHLWRRSFLGGPFDWVCLWDGTIVGNLTGLCWQHHQEITDNAARIIYDDHHAPLRGFFWNEVDGTTFLNPSPPMHGEPTPAVTSHTAPGPAAVERCGSCGRPLPHQHDEKREAPRRRKTWVVSCPDDGEDGGVVLDTLLDGCRDLFSHDENKATRYFTLVQALALVVQHGHLMVGEGIAE